LALGATFGIFLVLAGGVGAAYAADDEDSMLPDEKFFRSFLRGLGLRNGLDRQADDRLRPHQRARILRRHVVLADMHAFRTAGQRDVDAIVDQERHAGRFQHVVDGTRLVDHDAGLARLVAQLDQRRAAGGDETRQFRQGAPAGVLGIDDGVEAKIGLGHAFRSVDRDPGPRPGVSVRSPARGP